MTDTLVERFTEAVDLWARGQYRLVVLAAEFAASDEWAVVGARTPAHWIADLADIEICTAREWIRVGTTLGCLPTTADAFASQRISYSKVRTLTRVADPDNEQELLDIALATPAGRLTTELARWSMRNEDPDEISRRQRAQRSVTTRTLPDGMVITTARLPPLDGGRLQAALDTIVFSGNASAGVRATLAQQRADALTEMVSDWSGEMTTEVVLHVRGDGCSLDDGTPVGDSAVARAIPTAHLRALIHDADGRPIDASRRQRFPTVRQRRVVKERDRVCVDCGATNFLEYDHDPPYGLSGRTLVEELRLRCAGCHRARHASEHESLEAQSNGRAATP